MDSGYFCIGKDKYCLNIDKIVSYCVNDNEKGVKESEINEGYEIEDDGEMRITSRIVREMNSSLNPHNLSIKYDVINLLMTTLLDFSEKVDEDNVPLNVSLAINTLLEKNFIKKI